MEVFHLQSDYHPDHIKSIMIGSSRLAFEGSTVVVQHKCHHSVKANSLCGRRGWIFFSFYVLNAFDFLWEHEFVQTLQILIASSHVSRNPFTALTGKFIKSSIIFEGGLVWLDRHSLRDRSGERLLAATTMTRPHCLWLLDLGFLQSHDYRLLL